jgi:hypothetical protein
VHIRALYQNQQAAYQYSLRIRGDEPYSGESVHIRAVYQNLQE